MNWLARVTSQECNFKNIFDPCPRQYFSSMRADVFRKRKILNNLLNGIYISLFMYTYDYRALLKQILPEHHFTKSQ